MERVHDRTVIRVGVVGAGNHSRRNHGPALERYRDEQPDEIELRAVCDLDRDSAIEYAERYGFATTYEDFERMLAAESLDAVVAVTPVETTRKIGGELLTRGVPVLIEKPPGNTVTEARELRTIAAQNDAPHAVSFNRRFNPAVRRAREWIADHAADRPPTHAQARLLRTGRFEDEFIKNTCIHAVDTLCSFLGRPTGVETRQWQSCDSSSGRGTRCAAHARFTDAAAQFTFVSDSGTHAETYDLFGPGYTVRIDAASTRFSVAADGETVASWRASDDTARYERNGTLAETRAFLDAVHRGEGFSPTLSETVPSLDLAAAIDAGRDRTIE